MGIEMDEARTGSEDQTEVLGRRIAAGLIDIGVLFVLFVVLGILIGDSRSGDGGASVYLEGVEFLVFLGLALAYYFVLEATTGQTLGKRLLGIRVRGLDGGDASSGATAVRTLLRLIDSLPLFYLLGFLVALATRRRQRLGDLAGRTLVTRA
jgi:uncharacterized RDD family membrane protein YckC